MKKLLTMVLVAATILLQGCGGRGSTPLSSSSTSTPVPAATVVDCTSVDTAVSDVQAVDRTNYCAILKADLDAKAFVSGLIGTPQGACSVDALNQTVTSLDVVHRMATLIDNPLPHALFGCPPNLQDLALNKHKQKVDVKEMFSLFSEFVCPSLNAAVPVPPPPPPPNYCITLFHSKKVSDAFAYFTCSAEGVSTADARAYFVKAFSEYLYEVSVLQFPAVTAATIEGNIQTYGFNATILAVLQ